MIDELPAGPQTLGTVVYFHAGYWHTVLVNYPLCPEVGAAQIVDSASRALAQLTRLRQQQGNEAACLAIEGADHFSVLLDLIAPDGSIAHTLSHWAGR